MANYSRRHFLERIGAAAAGVFVAGRSILSSPVSEFSAEVEPFEMLVLGDSLIWGQGLKEEDKFYWLTKQWLQKEVFAQNRQVNLKLKAHSGSTLTLHEEEAEGFKKAGWQEETKFYHPEVNVSFPSIKTQIDLASREYQAEEKRAESVNLIMLSGGITDITVAALLNPFGNNKKLKNDIAKYCYDKMLEVLQHAASVFPNALIAVVGYYPIISPKTSSGKLYNALLEAYEFPRPLKPVANNIFTEQFFKIIHARGTRRSRIWAEHSDIKLQEAVKSLNAQFNQRRAIFIKTPITEETCLETKNTLLFKMGKKGKTEDAHFEERNMECNKSLKELKKDAGIKYSTRFCEISPVGHPNVEGSRAYAEAVKAHLKPILAPEAAK
jgi:hypothetical protein